MAKWHTGSSCDVIFHDEIDFSSISGEPLIKLKDKLAKKELKKKEKKEKKKKSSSIDLSNTLLSGESNETLPDIDPISDVVDYMALVGLKDEEEETDEFEEIVKTHKKTRSSKEKDEIRKDYADNLALLYNLLESSKAFEKKIEAVFDNMTNSTNRSSRAAAMPKSIADIASTVVQSRKATLDVIKEINSIKKVIKELQIKVDNNKPADLSAQSGDIATNNFINTIMNSYGRGNIIEQLRGAGTNSEPVSYGDNSVVDPINGLSFSGEAYGNIMEQIEERLDNEDNPYRSEEATKLIEYENMKPRYIVKRCIDDGEWKFIAVDQDNQEIFGCPVPSKESAGKMSFSPDFDYATDCKGRSYKVINYYR